MNTLNLRCTLATIFATGFLSLAWAEEGGGDDFVSNQAIVELEPGVDINDICTDYNTTVISAMPSERLYLLGLPVEMDEHTFEALLDEDDRIDCADLNRIGSAAGGSTQSFFFNVEPTQFSAQYSWKRIGLEKAQTYSRGEGVLVAVLDTGMDTSLPRISKRLAPGGYNFVDDNAQVQDVGDGIDNDGDGLIDEMTGHGTYLGGIITYVAPKSRILPVKVLDSDGKGEAFVVASGILYAINHGATVINLSLGTLVETDVISRAIERAHQAGIIVVAAAGNLNSVDPVTFPAADPNVIAVAALDSTDHKASFSNYGNYVTISAPGVAVVGPMPGGQFAMTDGTSAATALTAGAAALIKSRQPSITVENLRNLLISTAKNIDAANPGYTGLLGGGRLHIGRAMTTLVSP